jgi:hypothetical protein
MSEEKRPVLSLKRKPPQIMQERTTTRAPWCGAPKKVVVVSTPPAWKVKKEKLEKKAAEAAARNCAGGQSLKGTASGPVSSLTAAGTGHHDPEGILATAVRR